MVKKVLIRLGVVLLVLLVIGGLLFWWVNKEMHGSKSNSSVEQRFTIKSGEGVNQISSQMQQAGLITNGLFFDLYIWQANRESKIVTGTYLLRPNMPIPEIVDLITQQGNALPADVRITVIEGWNADDIGKYLAGKGVVTESDFSKEVKDVAKYQKDYAFLSDLKPGKDTLEGFLFPDTYLLYPKTSAEAIVYKMLDNFNEKLTSTMREDIRKQKRTIKEEITMASIIEKEVRKKSDKEIVAGIFWNRIRDNYPLQSCATINYCLESNKKQLSFEDTRVDSPYNTYINKGLPPGPIANPGIDSIMAAIYPQESDYFYFLSDLDTGETFFSRTLDEHNRLKEEHGL